MTCHFRFMFRAVLALACSTAVGLAVIFSANANSASAQAIDKDRPDTTANLATAADPRRVVGNDACSKCHAAEMSVWDSTAHATTFNQLHRTPAAKQIASKLGLRSIKHSGRCVECHYTQQASHTTAPSTTPVAADAATNVIAGVSCESCHGAAKDWLDIHQDYGGANVTRLTESPAHRSDRLRRSIDAGMRNPANVYLVAQSCLRCHTTNDEQLVNVGGHSAGSLDFEFVAWSQGAIRHNFVRSDGSSNAASSVERLRVMFVAGMIAELEASLRATASATEKATFGLTAAQRTYRAAKRLISVTDKVDVDELDEIVAIAAGARLKLNNQHELIDAANRIARLGIQFADANDGSQLAALDTYLPPVTH
ncbi:cytochrome c family protein [Stieleria sp. TO1_6]|uniref:cytochrome c family protein n=1 Tax=Stieleria tagensis TaxID=2956795 RepID=UPI00209AC169|nr:cytochrome c family protein [Stieleria tagensis]MCO8121215.1 cytochrome c family protein [Stieleria tagensis]